MGISADWSDHALWWPDRNMWLTRTRFTLDQYGVQADALLYFTPVHKLLRVELPDRRVLDCKVDFSIKTFNAVVQLCKELGVRHPEELSFCRPLLPEHLKQNYQQVRNRKISHAEEMSRGRSPLPPDTNTFIATASSNGSMYSRHNNSTVSSSSSGSSGGGYGERFLCAPVRSSSNKNTPISSPMSSGGSGGGGWNSNGASPYNTMNNKMNGSYSPQPFHLNGGNDFDLDVLAQSGPPVPPEIRNKMLRPKNLVERARMNVAWLDSSLSIMEQGVREFDLLCLRFKFYSFYDLNPKYDAVRINQLYEQARWQLLNEEIDCTEEEMLMFSALQLQVNLQANVPQPDVNNVAEDDIDAALNDLQITLEGSSLSSRNHQHVPELSDVLRVMKPKKFTLKSFKKYHATCRDLSVNFQKSPGDIDSSFSISLRGCEVTPDVNLSQGKFGIKLEVPGPEGMTEYWIRCDSEDQYARWMAACKLGSKGKTLADSSYDTEVRTIQTFLAMQKRAPAPAINPSSFEINPQDYVAARFLKKMKGKLTQRILEAHANVKDCNLIEAKMNYIKAWQSLPDFGISLFVVKFSGQKKDELLGVAFNRIMRMESNTGDHMKTWRYNTMKAWNVNWEVKLMMIQLDDENISFSCLSADCKVVHEFIGGYIFLSLRSKDASQTLNEEQFHKLTGGWS
ncbi:hypothetical protein Ocin01_04534 [Orchesella cincta]|uniref:Unc-112-related protein n=1 Tax=Orchesella cincta TaxID=48709 RepID=A0A1D2NA72_ORCCI|nr:hypothetical protein Ocin01_04534 [Orchesella cincta]